MQARDPLAPFIEPLERLGFPYCVTGSVAASDTGAMWRAPPEYVIVRKLEYLREGEQDKHVRDIRFMIVATTVDLPWIEAAVRRLGLGPQWLRCRA